MQMSVLNSSGPTAERCDEGSQERFITLNGRRIRFLQAGTGLPVVLAHGLGGYSFCFRHNLPALAAHYTVYALDFPGSGYSEAPAEGEGGLLALAKTLLGFICQLGLKSPAIIGNSHGGAVAIVAASLAQSEGVQLGPLVLVAPVNRWSRWGAKRAAMLGRPMGAAAFRLAAKMFLLPLHHYFLRRMYGDPARVTAKTVEGYAAALRQKGAARNLLARVKNWEADLRLVENALPVCTTTPILLIWGERDRAVDPASARHLLRALPQARLAVMPAAGHLPFEEQPEEFNALVLKFLAEAVHR